MLSVQRQGLMVQYYLSLPNINEEIQMRTFVIRFKVVYTLYPLLHCMLLA